MADAARESPLLRRAVVERCLVNPGSLAVCIREVQKTLAQSSKRQFRRASASARVPGPRRPLVTPGNGVIIFQGMQDPTAESMKSLEGFDVAWVEEAQSLSARSLRCCARRSETTARSCGRTGIRGASRTPSTNSCAKEAGQCRRCEANWRDNPWFPAELEEERNST